MSNLDIVSIGDCAIDCFVKVEEATVHCNIHHEDCLLCFSFANKIPYEALYMLSAGNASNAAVGSRRLGFKSAFYGTVGKDTNGETILKALRADKVDTRFMSIQKRQTNFHLVLWFKTERTILIKHQDFDYSLPKGLEKTKWIYLTSIGEKGLALHKPLEQFLNKHKDIKMSFNPGTYQLRLGAKKLSGLFNRTEIMCLNKEEAEMLVGINKDVEVLARRLHNLGPKIVVITDGLNGSYCLAEGLFHKVGIYPHHPIEATGAGDAYATAFTAAIMHGLHVTEALRWGARNGASVATKIGPQAGLLTHKQIIADLKKHKEFKVK